MRVKEYAERGNLVSSTYMDFSFRPSEVRRNLRLLYVLLCASRECDGKQGEKGKVNLSLLATEACRFEAEKETGEDKRRRNMPD